MAEGISDYLTATAPPPAAAAMPAPPKMRFADVLAGAFGAGPDRMGAYQKGIDTGSQFRLRSAQTDSAMAEAEKRRAEAMRQSQINDLITKAQNNPNYQPSVSDLLTVSTGAGDFTTGRLHEQERGFRDILGDPNAGAETAFAAGQGVQGKVLPHLYDVGGETVNMTADPNDTFQTPAQGATAAATRALERERLQPKPGVGAPAKPPAGYRYAADGQTMEFVPGGPADPSRQLPVRLPVAVQQGMSNNASLLTRIRNAKALVKANEGSFGMKYVLGDEVNQRVDPTGVTARAAVADLSSAQIHDRSGANVTAKEFPRLSPFVPAVTNTSTAILSKLDQMERAVLDEQDAIGSMYGAGAGAPPGAPPAGGAVPNGVAIHNTSKSGKPIVSHDGGVSWEYE